MTIGLNIALDSKRQRKPWVVRSVGGKAANGHLSPATAAAPGERSRRLQQQARVFATVENNRGRMFINVSSSSNSNSSRREGANILCKS